MTFSNNFTYSFNVNSSLEQVLEPLANWELAATGISFLVLVMTVLIMFSQWKRFGRKSSKLLKYALAFMYTTVYCSMPFSLLSVTQAVTPSHLPYYFAQFFYCCVLASSYVILYAKQATLFNMGMDTIMSETLLKRRRLLLTLFKILLIAYVLGWIAVFFRPTIYTIVLSETATTQHVRVVFIHANWLRILLALGDTSLSLTCLWLFVLNLVAFQNKRKDKHILRVSGFAASNGRGNDPVINSRLMNAASLNVKWTAVSAVSTFIFLVGCGFLQARFNTLWFTFGQIDGLVKLYSLGKMFPESSHGRTYSTRVVVASNADTHASVLSANEHSKSEHLFDSSVAAE